MKPDIEELFTEGQFQFMDEEFEACIVTFTQVIEKDPQCGKAFQARAIAKLRTGDKDGALDDIECALKCEPNNPRYHYHKGAILIQLDELDEAVESLSMAITLDPAHAPSYLLRSEVFEKLGDEESSSADMSKAMNLRREQTLASKIVDF